MYLTGEELRKRRKELGKSLDVLVEESGVSKGYISQYENGKISSVSDKTMQKLCIALGYTVASTNDEASNEVKVARLAADMKRKTMCAEDLLNIAENIQLDENDRSPRTAGDLNLFKAELYRSLRKFSKAVPCVVIAEEIFARNGDTLSWCKSVYESAMIKYDKNDYDEALGQFKIVINRLREVPYQNAFLAKIYVQIAKCASSIGKHHISKEYLAMLDVQKEFVPSADWMQMQAERHRVTGMALIGSHAYTDALKEFYKAEALYKEANSNIDILRTTYNIALVHMKMGDHEKALALAMETLDEQVEKKSPINDQADTLILISRTLLALGRHIEVSAFCNTIIQMEGVHVQRLAYAKYYLAEVEYANGDLIGFNSGLSEVISLLYQENQSEYAVRFMNRYMEVNHILNKK
ncbi:helix-turn-helix domain-containing protein [Tumebacillus flagellatus]|uniref:HTH cro/C1-type domain-containing protein n=1 Tax=Tumebacillus flagellatus TaxID=1157490 RepID=A0A074LV16_9BACL|nr:helix-turn-helix domain-containing protein [Tumebacillus flagellatus]KEO84794.1 hypothetical protein EL26_01935 [Tumebacillus flagellatus]